MKKIEISYGEAIRSGFEYILQNNPKSIVMGQGLWSPWYVGNTMTDLDKQFGKDRVIDTPVSELATTGAAIGAGLCGYSVIMVHPRMDFAILAADQIVNQAAKWRHMLGNQGAPNVTFRTIINRGGEQGAQHSQALHSWYAHIPGLRVLMPSSVQDARDMLISASQSEDPVLYIDDRWCYDQVAEIHPVPSTDITSFRPCVRRYGTDVTVVASGYSTVQSLRVAERLEAQNGIQCEVIDLRQINPLDKTEIVKSVNKTGLLCAVDGGWSNCGLAGEVIALASENIDPKLFKKSPVRLTLTDSPAPSAANLEDAYYTTDVDIEEAIVSLVST
jgi:acetoin:2,6-dichlorophenolindophenol oxidoreductase subunit beta